MALYSHIALLVALFLPAVWPKTTEGAPKMDFKPRIVGGRPASIVAYPFTVSVQVRFTHMCGGSIVSKRVVLTAAHCFYDPNTLRFWSDDLMSVLAGSTVSDTTVALTKMQVTDTIQRRQVAKMMAAPGHVPLGDGGGGPDVGLIIVDDPFLWTRWVQQAPLLLPGEGETPPADGTVCQTMGWGHVGPVPSVQQKDEGAVEPPLFPSLVLNVVELPIYAFEKCNDYYETLSPDFHICTLAPGRDACNGDSGGPMICNARQVAIVMAGDGCAQPDSPGAFSRLTPHLRWIWSVVETVPESERAQVVTPKKQDSPKRKEKRRGRGRGTGTNSYRTTIFNIALTCAMLTLCH